MTTRSTVASFFLTAALLAGGVAAQTPAGPPHFIIPPTGHSPGLDGVAMDGAGNLTFLWTRLSSTPTGFQQEAFIRRFSGADVPLGGPVRLASSRFDTVGGAVAANQRGDVLYTWSRRFTDPPSGRTDFFLRRTSPVLPTLTLLIKGDSEVAVDNAGNFVVVWPTSTIEGNRVHGQRYNRDGTKRGREFDVAPSATGSHFSPSIAMNPNTGEFVVVWEVWDDEFRPVSVRGQRFGFFSGRQGSEIEIYTQPAGEVPSVLAFFAPQVARAANGSFVVVWKTARTEDRIDSDILGQRYNTEGLPLGGRMVIADDAFIPDGRPRIAMAPNGRFVVSWDDQGTSPQWFRLFRPNGTPLGPVIVQPAMDAPYNGSGRVAFGKNDSFVLGWTNYNDEGAFGNTISYQRYEVP